MTALVVDRVTVAYRRGVPVLSDVSLTVPAGRLVAVTGASGAGKTTLLWTMAGLLRPLHGTVSLAGGPVGHGTGRVVLIPQEAALAPVLTAEENLLVSLLSAGHPLATARRLAAEALQRLGLEVQADQLAEELSGGQQQRTAIARGLALRGDVLLADEVTSNLDADNRRRVLALLRAEADRGAAVVFATHDPDAAAVCDARVHLVDGRVAVPVAG